MNNNQNQQDAGTKKFNLQANPGSANKGSDAQGQNLNQKGQNNNQQGQSNKQNSSSVDSATHKDATAQLGEQSGADRQGKLAREQIKKGEEEIDVEGDQDKGKNFNTETWGKGGQTGRDNMQPNKSGGV